MQGDASKCKASTTDAHVAQLHAGAMSQEHFPPLVMKQTKTTDGMADMSTTDSPTDEQPAVVTTATVTTSEPVDTWASITGKQYDSLFTGMASEHVSQVHPMFVAYKKVSWDSYQIPISEVASAVTNAIENAD